MDILVDVAYAPTTGQHGVVVHVLVVLVVQGHELDELVLLTVVVPVTQLLKHKDATLILLYVCMVARKMVMGVPAVQDGQGPAVGSVSDSFLSFHSISINSANNGEFLWS